MSHLTFKQRLAPLFSQLPSILSAVAVIWLLQIFVAVSMTALIFSGELSAFTAQGMGFLLFGTLAFTLVTSLSSAFVNAIGGLQSVAITTISLLVANIVAQMNTAALDAQMATAVVAITAATLLTGIAFVLIGTFKLGQLVCFIPYPVIGGFMAATGWALLLNVSSMKVTAQTDADFNRELRFAGLANIVAGLGGSGVGFHHLSLSTLNLRLGGRSRLVGVAAAVLIGLTIFLGAAALAVVPKLIAGGLLVYLAFSLLWDWLIKTWFQLDWLDYGIIWFILLATIFVGFLEGIGLGIVLAGVLFVVDYSRIDMVRHALTGAERRSRVVRPLLYEQLLRCLLNTSPAAVRS